MSFIKQHRRRPCNAVNTAIGIEDACSHVTLSGFRAKFDSDAHAYSANAPLHEPNTASPSLNCVMFLPAASISPATSAPSRESFGLRSPPAAMRTGYGSPLIKCQSYGLTAAARTLIRTSSSLGTGFSTSAIWTTSGGPYLV